MEYSKLPLSFEDQADLLISRGLIVPKKNELVEILKKINYYRLSGYLFIFKQIDPFTKQEIFIPGTDISIIIQRYEFDRQIRILLLDAIERIEVAILRTRFVEKYSLNFGAFGYSDYSTYNSKFCFADFEKLMDDIKNDEIQSHEQFITHYHSKYDNQQLPIWMLAEIMSYGQLFTLFRNTNPLLKREIANEFHLYSNVLDSWLHTLNFIRNCCAHHCRLWNRELPISPIIPDKKHDKTWYEPATISNRRIFVVLTLTRYLLFWIDQKNEWHKTVISLIEKNPEIPLSMMGFPKNWQDTVFWK